MALHRRGSPHSAECRRRCAQVPPRPPRNNGRTSPDRSSGVLTFEMTPPRRTNGASSHDDEVQLLLSTSANAPREGTHTNGALGPPSPRHAHHGHGLGDGEKCGACLPVLQHSVL